MKRSYRSIKISLLFVWFSTIASAQIAPYYYWIQFTDKKSSAYSINEPWAFLSERSIERRLKQGIEIDTSDIPVNQNYIDSLRKLSLTIINVSKWLNGVVVETSDPSLLTRASNLSFVSSLSTNSRLELTKKSAINKFNLDQNSVAEFSYGLSENQIKMLQGDYLHNNDFLGQGKLIAVLDAGFYNANQISSLQHLWANDQIVATYDFVKDNSDFYSTYQHGTIVLSAMAGVEDNYLIGTAPEADYVLVRTEKSLTEYIIEEYNWVCGAEFADSIGADIINSSLGYTTFFDENQDHSYSDMDGRTCVSSIGANMASDKGIIVVASAGNEGNKPWFRIGSPADADGILTVGAVDSVGEIANFSSRGPSYDGRIKPDICAQGVDVVAQNQSGGFIKINGTSLASPLISGMVACLWQANPEATNSQIIDAIRQSSSRFYRPDSVYGYGIPDFRSADRLLKIMLNKNSTLPFNLYTYPNPAKNYLKIDIYKQDFTKPYDLLLTVYDLLGRVQYQEKAHIVTAFTFYNFSLLSLNSGIYYIVLNIQGRSYSSMFIKIN
jgi:serine protease AprX